MVEREAKRKDLLNKTESGFGEHLDVRLEEPGWKEDYAILLRLLTLQRKLESA